MSAEFADAAARAVRQESPFRVLMVCTFNHCRSPLAEHLLRQAIQDRGRQRWAIESAGLYARDGLAAHPYVRKILAERGVDTKDWRSQLVRGEHIAWADLILTAEVEHGSVLVRRFPEALRRTFALLPFSAWLQQVEPPESESQRGTRDALIRRALEGRARSQPLPKEEQDLADPMGQSIKQFRECRDRIQAALDPIVDLG
jgi:protein-tyrosine phosphatase